MEGVVSTLAKVLRFLGIAVMFVGAAFVQLPHIYQVLLVFMAADMITGIFRASQQGTLTSSVAWNGTMKKAGELLIVGVGAYLQQIVSPLGDVPLPEALSLFYIYNEGLSVIENLAAIGVPIPDFLRQALAEISPDKQIPTSGRSG